MSSKIPREVSRFIVQYFREAREAAQDLEDARFRHMEETSRTQAEISKSKADAMSKLTVKCDELFKQQKFDELITCCNDRIALDPDNRFNKLYSLHLIAVSMRGTGKPDEAITYFNKVIELLQPAEGQDAIRSVALIKTQIAEMLSRQGKFDDALTCCEEALRIYPECTKALRVKATLIDSEQFRKRKLSIVSLLNPQGEESSKRARF